VIRESDGVHARYNPSLPIIVLTGRGAASGRVRGFDLGADDYVQKPFGYDELCGRESPPSCAVATAARTGRSRPARSWSTRPAGK
jgi:CheY-like chemotaxis protein